MKLFILAILLALLGIAYSTGLEEELSVCSAEAVCITNCLGTNQETMPTPASTTILKTTTTTLCDVFPPGEGLCRYTSTHLCTFRETLEHCGCKEKHRIVSCENFRDGVRLESCPVVVEFLNSGRGGDQADSDACSFAQMSRVQSDFQSCSYNLTGSSWNSIQNLEENRENSNRMDEIKAIICQTLLRIESECASQLSDCFIAKDAEQMSQQHLKQLEDYFAQMYPDISAEECRDNSKSQFLPTNPKQIHVEDNFDDKPDENDYERRNEIDENTDDYYYDNVEPGQLAKTTQSTTTVIDLNNDDQNVDDFEKENVEPDTKSEDDLDDSQDLEEPSNNYEEPGFDSDSDNYDNMDDNDNDNKDNIDNNLDNEDMEDNVDTGMDNGTEDNDGFQTSEYSSGVASLLTIFSLHILALVMLTWL